MVILSKGNSERIPDGRAALAECGILAHARDIVACYYPWEYDKALCTRRTKR